MQIPSTVTAPAWREALYQDPILVTAAAELRHRHSTLFLEA